SRTAGKCRAVPRAAARVRLVEPGTLPALQRPAAGMRQWPARASPPAAQVPARAAAPRTPGACRGSGPGIRECRAPARETLQVPLPTRPHAASGGLDAPPSEAPPPDARLFRFLRVLRTCA